MKFPRIRWAALPAMGMAIFPFILIKDEQSKNNKQLIYHELIHLRQQMELLVIPFFILYLLNYMVNLIRYKNHDKAYRNIVFEREAYANDSDYSYLNHRGFFSWTNYLRRD